MFKFLEIIYYSKYISYHAIFLQQTLVFLLRGRYTFVLQGIVCSTFLRNLLNIKKKNNLEIFKYNL